MGKKGILVFLFICLGVTLSSCTKRVCEKYSSDPNFEFPGKNVAVVGNCSSINAEIERVLIGHPRSRYRVIERSHLEALLKEQGYAVTGTIDPRSLSNIGKIAAVDALVITDCGGDDPRMRFVKTSSGEVLAVATGYGGTRASRSARAILDKILPVRGEHCYKLRGLNAIF